MRLLKFIVLILVSVCYSCSKTDDQLEDHFFVSNDDAIMPVYVRGNLSSDKILLFLHGGPGGSASQATFIPAFEEIEETIPIAYWDQRASGLSQGNPDTSTYNLDQFVEDTYFVIEALKQRFPNKAIFILGHSWGGALGAAFLSTSDYQSSIDGFICMNSGHNLVKGLPLSVDWVENYAEEQINQDLNKDNWLSIQSWCEKNPDMTNPDNYFTYVDYLNQTDAYRVNNEEYELTPVSLDDILNSRLSLGIMVGGYQLSKNFNILELNLSDQMSKITIPTLVLWGRHDGVNTLEMGYDAYNSIGTVSTNKELIILENSAHEGYLEEPEIFIQSVLDFVN